MSSKQRPQFRNVSIPAMIPYVARFPAPAWVSLLHRISGVLLFLLLPTIIWAFDASISSKMSFAKLMGVFESGLGIVPGWLLKLAVLSVLWAYLHHLIAGLRFVLLDVKHSAVEKQRSTRSARWVLIASLSLTAALGAKIFGLF